MGSVSVLYLCKLNNILLNKKKNVFDQIEASVRVLNVSIYWYFIFYL